MMARPSHPYEVSAYDGSQSRNNTGAGSGHNDSAVFAQRRCAPVRGQAKPGSFVAKLVKIPITPPAADFQAKSYA